MRNHSRSSSATAGRSPLPFGRTGLDRRRALGPSRRSAGPLRARRDQPAAGLPNRVRALSGHPDAVTSCGTPCCARCGSVRRCTPRRASVRGSPAIAVRQVSTSPDGRRPAHQHVMPAAAGCKTATRHARDRAGGLVRHAEPALAPAHRTTPAVVRRLWTGRQRHGRRGTGPTPKRPHHRNARNINSSIGAPDPFGGLSTDKCYASIRQLVATIRRQFRMPLF